MNQQSHSWAYAQKKKKNLEKCRHPNLIAALFTIDRTQKQPKCSSTEEWIKRRCSTYIYIYIYIYNGILCL